MRSRIASAVLSLALLSGGARAQNFNLDVGDNLILWPVPSSVHAAAASQPGFWNNVKTPYSVTLSDLSGTPTSVTCTSTIPSSFNWPFGPLTGDDSALMDDVQSISPFSGTAVWTFNGLLNGNYLVYTYGWAPDSVNARTSVDVPGSSDPLQIVGGAWGGSPHVLGVTYALHHASVTSGTLVVNCAGALGPGGTVTAGSVNGFQLVLEGGCFCPSSFCVGFNNAACPCGMAGTNPGAGCGNESGTGGALLGASLASGSAASVSDDSDTTPQVFLDMSLAPALKTTLFIQGTTQITAVNFGDGLRCVGGALIRLNGVPPPGDPTTAGGTLSYPLASGAHTDSITVRCASVAQPINAGDTRHYFAQYRDPNPNACNVSVGGTNNVTNAITIVWGP